MLIFRRVAGLSMLPALRPGQLIVAVRILRLPWRGVAGLQPGQVVVLEHEGLEKIKRVSRVRDGRVFVVGDNLSASTDSRHFGWLSYEAVRGRVVYPRFRRCA